MPISAPPTIPLITDPSTFATRAQDWVVWQANELYVGLVEASTLLFTNTSDISATSNTISSGSKTFTVSAEKSFRGGMYLVIADTAAPSTNSLFCQVTSYSGTTLIVDVISIRGSGTKTAWTISLSASGGASTGVNSDITSLTGLSGNLSFTGTGNRITGDFSNGTVANQVIFQTSTVNAPTGLVAIPNGTSTTAGLSTYNSSDTLNGSFTNIFSSSTSSFIASDKRGTGSYLPITFVTSNLQRMQIDDSGNVLVISATGALGYGTGAGGVVTQATSKSTGVTLNKPTGTITMSGAALGAGVSVFFIVTNSLVTARDSVLVTGTNLAVDANNYRIECAYVASGNFAIRVTNITGGSLSQAVGINFAVIKGSAT